MAILLERHIDLRNLKGLGEMPFPRKSFVFSCFSYLAEIAIELGISPNVGDNPPQPGRDCGSEKDRTLRSG